MRMDRTSGKPLYFTMTQQSEDKPLPKLPHHVPQKTWKDKHRISLSAWKAIYQDEIEVAVDTIKNAVMDDVNDHMYYQGIRVELPINSSNDAIVNWLYWNSSSALRSNDSSSFREAWKAP